MSARVTIYAGVIVACLSTGTLGAQRPADQPRPAAQERSTGKAISDGWITMKIHSQFIPEDALEGSDIDVDTMKGVVTLSGTVPSAAAKARAVAIANATDGVKSVTDQLRVSAPVGTATGAAREAGRDVSAAAREAGRDTSTAAKKTGRSINDGWIKSKIYSQYLTEDALDDSDLDIDVKAGVVTLSGTVKSAAGHSRAIAIAKATDGVKSVKDAVKVSAASK